MDCLGKVKKLETASFLHEVLTVGIPCKVLVEIKSCIHDPLDYTNDLGLLLEVRLLWIV